MKNIKTKPFQHTTREMTQASRSPREITHKLLMESKDKVSEATENYQPQSESPERYAEKRIENAAYDSAHSITHRSTGQGKNITDRIRKLQRSSKEFNYDSRGNESNSSFSYQKSSDYIQGKNQAGKAIVKTHRYIRKSNKLKAASKGTIKTTQKTIKATRQGVKAGPKAIKTSLQTAKAARKAAHTTVKTAQAAVRTAKAAAKAAVTTAKAIVKAISVTVKAAIAAIKSLIAAIAAGGWIAIVIIIIVALIALIGGSAFGIFLSDDTGAGFTINEAVTEITSDFQTKVDNKINELSSVYAHDEVKVLYEGDTDGDSASINNWSDVLTIFAVKYMGENIDVINITSEKIAELKNIFNTMNYFTACTVTKSEEVTVTDDQGEEESETKTTLLIYIRYTSLSYEETMLKYSFTDEQREIAEEMMSPAYYTLFANLMGVDIYGDVNLTEIISNLPAGTEGAEVVKAALTRLGSPYVMGAKGDKRFDCSGLVYWSIAQIDPKLGKKMYTNAAGQAKYCLKGGYAVGRSELMPGDLVFWQNLNCPGCSRWKEVHHTGIYIGNGKVIEASSSKGRVVIRDLWSSSGYPLFMFGRPYENK